MNEIKEADRRVWLSASDDETDLQQYRSISRMALLSFGLMVVSLLVVINPLQYMLFLFPIASALTAVGALRSIAKQPTEIVGRKMALVSLVISCFIIAYAPTRNLTRSQTVSHDGREFLQQWFELIQANRYREAHQLSLAAEDRRNANESLDDFYNEMVSRPDAAQMKASGSMTATATQMMDKALKDNQRQLEQFLTDPVVAELIELANQGKLALAWKNESRPEGGGIVKFARVEDVQQMAATDEMVFRLILDQGENHFHSLRITVLREYKPASRTGVWRAKTIKDASSS